MSTMKKLNLGKQQALIIIFLIVVVFAFLWNKHSVSKDFEPIRKVNSTSLNRKLLIISSESPFKDSITSGIIRFYDSTRVIVEVIDVRKLSNIDLVDFDAILIMHRWEAGAPSENLQLFMDENSDLKNKMVVLSTSWNGKEKMKNIDALSGASVLHEVPSFTTKIIKRLDGLLK